MKLQTALNLIPTVSIPLRFHGQPLPVPNFKYVPKLNKQLNEQTIPEKILKWFESRNRRYLIFVPTIELAEQMAKQLDHTPYVHAESEDRKELIQQFRDRKLNRLITTTILERGVTFPSIDVAVIQADHQVFDEAALIQIAGRAGRSAKDPNGDVTFFYETKTRALVSARNYSIKKNKEAEQLNVLKGE
ncbi:helicase-related protein [Bacillaceae bacterium W0354]